ncbi:hypothetical protein NUH16_003270 [Penicillium rubens]|nr:hypothetical protein NUH16_003270 [Penicillium rubens]
MTVQFIITGGFITRLWLSEVARCTQRGFFEATAGDCDDLDTTSCQHGMNGDHIDEDNCNKHTAIFMNWRYPRVPITRVEFERRSVLSAHALRYRWNLMLCRTHMTIVGIDIESM